MKLMHNWTMCQKYSKGELKKIMPFALFSLVFFLTSPTSTAHKNQLKINILFYIQLWQSVQENTKRMILSLYKSGLMLYINR